MFPCPEKQDLSITTHDGMMMGRYRYTEDIHGLFDGGQIPTHATTTVIPCTVAMEDSDSRKGNWWYDIDPSNDQDCEEPDNTDGIVFLGKGLIKISPHFFMHVHGRIGNAVFGIKVDDYCEDFEALEESWNAIRHKFNTRDKLGRPPLEWDSWDYPTAEWNEDLVDGLVDRLYDYGKLRREAMANAPRPVSPKDSIASRMIARWTD